MLRAVTLDVSILLFNDCPAVVGIGQHDCDYGYDHDCGCDVRLHRTYWKWCIM